MHAKQTTHKLAERFFHILFFYAPDCNSPASRPSLIQSRRFSMPLHTNSLPVLLCRLVTLFLIFIDFLWCLMLFRIPIFSPFRTMSLIELKCQDRISKRLMHEDSFMLPLQWYLIWIHFTYHMNCVRLSDSFRLNCTWMDFFGLHFETQRIQN